MQCIYFGSAGKCYANPSILALAGKYKPDEETKNKYCKTGNFRTCPRFLATLKYLTASKSK